MTEIPKPAPLPPEGEPKKCFNVKIEQPDQIWKAAKEGKSGQLGMQLLEKPLNNLDVSLISGKENFELIAKLDTTHTADFKVAKDMYEWQIMENIIPALKQTYPNSKERGGKLILTGSRGTKLIIGNDEPTNFHYIEISTGTIKGALGKAREQVVPSPIKTQENLNAALQDLADILKTSTENIYKLAGKEAPDEELVLRPPKQEIGVGKTALGEIRTPQELLGKLEIEKPDVSFEDIGGQVAAKREIEGLAFALKNPELYRKWGTKPPKGVILYGPPGTGKTLMAKALASQAEARFLHVETSDIASKWYGESEKIVKTIFELAGQNGEKTIIFFDEIDAIAPKREGSHEATQRTIGTLLENMDGMGTKDNVMIVASTNRLDDIEPALLRSGRFDRWVEVGLPDEEGRKQIFNIHMKKAKQRGGRDLFKEDIKLDEIIAKTDGTSGADIAEIVRRTLEEKVRQEGTTGQEPGKVGTEDILKQLEQYEKIRKVKNALTPSPEGMYL